MKLKKNFSFKIGYPAYSGVICENLNCTNEPRECQDPRYYTSDDCTYGTIPYYCPVLCGKCSASTTTTTTVSKLCSIKSCSNGGKLNTTTCQCLCMYFWWKINYLNHVL